MPDDNIDKSPGKISTEISKGSQCVLLHLGEGESAVEIAALDATSLDALISKLGIARSHITEPVIPDPPPGMQPITAYDPRWMVTSDSDNKFAAFWIRHPGFGWSIYAFSRHEAANISKWLRKIIAVTNTKDTQSPAATSVEIGDFLVTTEGLGFYYYGKGEKRIGPNPFEQIEFDSDRAAGIVAGSIVEQRLEQAIRSRLRADLPSVAANLFRPSGPLGPFSNKIQLSYLMGIITADAFKDLENLKSIRNDFAHEVNLDSFDIPTIRDRCKNFRIIDRHVGPVPQDICEEISGRTLAERANPYMGLPDYDQKIVDPRFRYTMTAQLISYILGTEADSEIQKFLLFEILKYYQYITLSNPF